MNGTFAEQLQGWVGGEVTVVNPESFKSTALGKGLTFQTYKATLDELGADFIRLSFSSPKGESPAAVQQIIPINRIKRVSVWGDERIVHL